LVLFSTHPGFCSSIIGSNGDLDPWTAGGMTRDVLSPSVTVIMLADAARCSDLRAANVNDPAARELYEEKFRVWITTYVLREMQNLSCGIPKQTWIKITDRSYRRFLKSKGAYNR
jgi:hypothetical protein